MGSVTAVFGLVQDPGCLKYGEIRVKAGLSSACGEGKEELVGFGWSDSTDGTTILV